MNGSPVLIIFIDGLGFESVEEHTSSFLSSLDCAAVQPGFGYSINIYNELFAGLRPDDYGFLNKWSLRDRLENEAVYPGSTIFPFGDWCRFFPWLSRLQHKIYERLTGAGSLDNIPFRYLDLFQRQPESSIFSGRQLTSLFRLRPFKMVLSSEISKPPGQRDCETFEQALEKMDNQPYIFLMFADLDTIGHRHALGPRYQQHIQKLDRWIHTLVDKYTELYPDGAVAILSDHGMAPVRQPVSVCFEKQFGSAGWGRYAYFLDSSFLRVWVMGNNDVLKTEIVEYLNSFSAGHILSEDSRREFGITSRKFGHIIYLLDEGYVFYPGFMGSRLQKGMHGYWPKLSSQQGLFCKRANSPLGCPVPQKSIEVYRALANLLHEGA